MKEYMLLIHDRVNHHDDLTESRFHEFLKKCEVYILNLQKQEKLISAQPLVREGIIISGKSGSWKEEPFNEKKEVQVGYYHILAKNMEEAISIAKGNPEFEYGTTVRIEVRPIKTKEITTNFEYPKTTVST
ncbi:MAG: YciI family protein [Paludibacter sp.]|nr:YciI family protein [Paludibacter sp.]